jgi:hypothetical protein
MARVSLYANDITEDGVPPVCMACGQPAEVTAVKAFRWNPGWVYFLILVGLLPFLIVALVASRQRSVPTPFCNRHAGYWRSRARLVLGGLLGVALMGVAIVATAPTEAPTPPWLKALWAGAGIATFVWLFSAAIVQASSIRAGEITANRIVLLGVNAEYAAAVRQRQADREARNLDPAVPNRNWPRTQRSEFYDD